MPACCVMLLCQHIPAKLIHRIAAYTLQQGLHTFLLVLICVCLSVQGQSTQPAGLVAASPVPGVHPGICPQQQRVVCSLAPRCASRQCLRVSRVWRFGSASCDVCRSLDRLQELAHTVAEAGNLVAHTRPRTSRCCHVVQIHVYACCLQ